MKNTLTNRVTPRERQVLIELCQGKSNKEIARTLGLKFHTVAIHMASLRAKLGALNRTHLAILALFNGIPSLHFIETGVDLTIERRNFAKDDPNDARTL